MELLLSIGFGLWYIISAVFFGIMTGKWRNK